MKWQFQKFRSWSEIASEMLEFYTFFFGNNVFAFVIIVDILFVFVFCICKSCNILQIMMYFVVILWGKKHLCVIAFMYFVFVWLCWWIVYFDYAYLHIVSVYFEKCIVFCVYCLFLIKVSVLYFVCLCVLLILIQVYCMRSVWSHQEWGVAEDDRQRLFPPLWSAFVIIIIMVMMMMMMLM